jgi:quinol monooxygenase YgiN
MTMARLYKMTAADGKEETLLAALQDLKKVVAPLGGCQGIDIMRDRKQPGVFLFLERWQSAEIYKEAAGHLSKDTLGPVMAVLGPPPEASSLDYLD